MDGKLIGLLMTVIVVTGGGVAGAWATFETKDSALAREERQALALEVAAADREKGDLQTRLDLVKLKIKRLTDIAGIRPLTDEEKIELESLRDEQAILLKRLTDLG